MDTDVKPGDVKRIRTCLKNVRLFRHWTTRTPFDDPLEVVSYVHDNDSVLVIAVITAPTGDTTPGVLLCNLHDGQIGYVSLYFITHY